MKKLLFTLFSLVFFLPLTHVYSIYNPLEVANNRFGIHIIEQSDLDQAERLINSKNGLWGYVTLVIRDDQMNLHQWSSFFKKLRLKHLIPIVRIATHVENGIWVKPKIEESTTWANFLDKLPWPTKNRYVILFNEPNHSKEWGGIINPAEYARIVEEYTKAFKDRSDEFFILNAGFDLAASTIPYQTMDVLSFWHEMENEVPGVFNYFDGWASHSYPNPNFSASPYNTGRISIVGYRFEQDYLQKKFNVPKKPVFLTETGWQIGNLTEETISQYYKIAFEEIWTDSNLVAVTPFLLNYPESPFLTFSWLDKEGEPRLQYQIVEQISKAQGNPKLVPQTYFGKLMEKKVNTSQKITYIPDLIF